MRPLVPGAALQRGDEAPVGDVARARQPQRVQALLEGVDREAGELRDTETAKRTALEIQVAELKEALASAQSSSNDNDKQPTLPPDLDPTIADLLQPDCALGIVFDGTYDQKPC